MFHAFLQFFDHHERAIYLIFWAYLALFWSLRYGWFFWRRHHRHELDVTLAADEQDDDRLAITVVNRSRRRVPIRKIDLEIYSEDLNRGKLNELRQHVMLSKTVDEVLASKGSARFEVERRIPERDEIRSLHVRELVSDLNVLGVEIAQLTSIVWDDKSQSYRSNSVRLPVYRLVSANDGNGLAKSGVAG